jgi:CheY-like chemotaxis protein/predicted transcriptional regulator
MRVYCILIMELIFPKFCIIKKNLLPMFFYYKSFYLAVQLTVSSHSLLDVLSALADAKSLLIFESIASEDVDSNVLLMRTNLTIKQYYSRISALLDAGLVQKKHKKYALTSLGKVVYESQVVTQRALDNHWILKAIDSLDGVPKEEQETAVINLIQDPELREWLTKKDSQLHNGPKLFQTIKQNEVRNGANVMLVEDEPDLILTFKTVLVSNGYNVDEFTDSFEAFKHFTMLNRPFYDLALLDIRMRGMNGIQLYQKLKAVDDRLQIRFITALDAANELVSLIPNFDLNHIIRKPISNEDLLAIVKNAMTKSS